jgi:hemoglobin
MRAMQDQMESALHGLAGTPVCSEQEVVELVHAFYAKVRRDAVLGPVFDAHVADWDGHLAKLVDFWSSALRGTARYRGSPVPRHAALPGLTTSHFHRWLALFRETTASLDNPALQARADYLAHRIAGSLWYGYQAQHCPEVRSTGQLGSAPDEAR